MLQDQLQLISKLLRKITSKREKGKNTQQIINFLENCSFFLDKNSREKNNFRF